MNVGGLLRSKKTMVLADQLIFSGANFIMTLFIARLLDAKSFGIYSTIVLTLFLIISISNALIIQPLQVAPEKFRKSNLYSHFLFFSQIAVIAITLLIALFVQFFIQSEAFSFPALGLMSIGIIFQDFARKFFLVKDNLTAVLTADVLTTIFQFLGISFLYVKQSCLLSDLLVVMGLAYWSGVFYSVLKIKPKLLKQRYCKVFLHYHLKEGSWLSLVSFVQWGAGNLLVLSLGVFIHIEALGAFRLVQSLFGVLNILFQTFENYVLPNASRLYSQSIGLSKKYIRKISLQGSLLMGFVLSVLFIFSDQVIWLAGGNKYNDYGYVIKGMCILYFILFVGYPIRLSIRMLVLNRLFFTGYLLSFIFSILFLNTLLKYWQLNGVVTGLIINQLIMLIFWNYHLNRKGFYLWK